MADGQTPRLHEDSELFRASLNFTERDSGFSARLIEKDYLSSVMLADLRELFERRLVFKGGTSLSKVHTEFYRMSEDLDFVISMPIDSSRVHRRATIKFRERLVQNLSPGQHTLRLVANGDGPVTIDAFDVFEPPLKKTRE